MNPDRVILLRYWSLVKGLTELWIKCIVFDTLLEVILKESLNSIAIHIDNVRIPSYSSADYDSPISRQETD